MWIETYKENCHIFGELCLLVPKNVQAALTNLQRLKNNATMIFNSFRRLFEIEDVSQRFITIFREKEEVNFCSYWVCSWFVRGRRVTDWRPCYCSISPWSRRRTLHLHCHSVIVFIDYFFAKKYSTTSRSFSMNIIVFFRIMLMIDITQGLISLFHDVDNWRKKSCRSTVIFISFFSISLSFSPLVVHLFYVRLCWFDSPPCYIA